MDFVVNEWLPEYFRPDAEKENQTELFRFIEKFSRNKDKIFVRNPSEFLNKIYRYEKKYHDRNFKIRTKWFIANVLLNSDKCQEIKGDSISLPDEIISRLLKGNYESDTYLFESASLTDSKMIITTDDKLIKIMEGNGVFNVINCLIF